MARLQVPVTVITYPNVDKPADVVGDPVNGHYFAGNNGGIYIEAYNSDASDHTVSVHPSETVLGLTLEDLVVTVPAGATKMIGPFATGVFSQGDQSVNFDVDDATILLWAFDGGAGI